MVKVGDKIPPVKLKKKGESGLDEIDMAKYVAGRKVVIFGVPGAFTPLCWGKHLPGYIEKANDIKSKGVDEIICVAVNDPFVMKHWGEVANADNKVTMMPDGNGEFTKALGLTLDGSGFGLGQRSQRYSMTVENGIIKDLKVESNPGELTVADAQTCAANL